MKKIVLFISSLLALNVFSAEAQIYRDGFTNDYNAPIAQFWGAAPSGLVISHLAHSGVTTVVGNGTNGTYVSLVYLPYDNPQMLGIGAYTGASGSSITSLDITGNNKVYVVVRSTVSKPLTLQLKDVNNYVTSAGAPTYIQTVGTTSSVLTWDFTGAMDGGYGGTACASGPCSVDLTKIKEFGFQIDAANGAYSGTMAFDYIQVGGTAPVLPTLSFATPTNLSTITAFPASLTSSVTAGTAAIDSVAYFDATTRIGSSATGTSYSYNWTGTSNGAHALTAIAYDHLGIMNNATIAVSVACASITPSFTSSSPSDLTATLTGSTTGGTPASYDWNFGDGSTHATTASASRTYTAANTYTVTYTVYDACGNPYTASNPVTVSCAAITPSFSSSTTGLNATLTGSTSGGTPVAYDWNFGDGSTHATTANAFRSYASANTYSVTYTVYDVCGNPYFVSNNVTVTGPCIPTTLTPSFTSSTNELTATLTGATSGGTPTAYDWNYGDASTHGTTASSSRTYASANTYTVTYTVYDNCNNPYTVSHPVTVSCAAITPSFTSSTSGLTATLTGATTGGTAVSYDWDFGDASTHATTASASRAYVNANTYTVTYTVHDACNNPYTVSHPVTVAAPATSVSTAQATISSTKLYPNPVSDMVNIEMELKSSSTIKITLTDLMGKEVMTIANGTMSSLNESFSVANLHKGIYTVNYFINGSAAKAELLMVK
jgi:PKD repeat protein